MDADTAVSPVIGTILMVAVTVALAATVLAIMNGFGGDTPSEASSSTFNAQAIDTDNNRKTDALRLTYIQGPVATASDVHIVVTSSAGTPVTFTAPATWTPGDFIVINPPAGAGGYQVSVSVLGTTVLSTSIQLDE